MRSVLALPLIWTASIITLLGLILFRLADEVEGAPK